MGTGGWRQREEMAKQEIFADILNKEESSVQGHLAVLCAFSEYLKEKFQHMVNLDIEYSDAQAKRIAELGQAMAEKDVLFHHKKAKMIQEGEWEKKTPRQQYHYRTSLGLTMDEEIEICGILIAASSASIRENKKDRRRAIGSIESGREGSRSYQDVMGELETALLEEAGGEGSA